MGTTSFTVCPGCSRHVRCGERACPFCGASVSSFARVLEYRINTRLDRYRSLSLGAALTAAGFVTNCSENATPVYGIACTPTTCPDVGGSAGTSAAGGSSGEVTLGGVAGTTPTSGTPGGGVAGTNPDAGNAGMSQQLGGAGSGGDETSGAGGSEPGGAAGSTADGGSALGGASGAGGNH
ncbi:MAG TPA: hypothetical protein VNG33_15600 [Polyangiaceae bacterium]|nr:hypothetical protein [Polyangiaceae bacterium]